MIINPLFFYMMQVCNNVRIAMFIIAWVPAIIAVSMVLIDVENNLFPICDEDDEKKWAATKKAVKRLICATLLMLFIGIIIPSKDTILLMQAAKLTTTENVNSMFEALKAAMDYAVTILE